jgi:hypothetical protein
MRKADGLAMIGELHLSIYCPLLLNVGVAQAFSPTPSKKQTQLCFDRAQGESAYF